MSIADPKVHGHSMYYQEREKKFLFSFISDQIKCTNSILVVAKTTNLGLARLFLHCYKKEAISKLQTLHRRSSVFQHGCEIHLLRETSQLCSTDQPFSAYKITKLFDVLVLSSSILGFNWDLSVQFLILRIRPYLTLLSDRFLGVFE